MLDAGVKRLICKGGIAVQNIDRQFALLKKKIS
jgi:hypothetical protein